MSDKASRLSRYEVGIDSYRAAKILIDRYGDGAKTEASLRLQDLLEAGDRVGALAWAEIVYAVEEMQRVPLDGEARN